ncbi:hypothetical protein IPC688_29380 [Pseudomonas aeruginosa]|nr:hypothetical protein IPC688_29380 [Pseudomonas aeruginosa]
MFLPRLMPLALLTLALSACTTQPRTLCQPLNPPALLMTPPRALHSLPSAPPLPPTTQPATPTPSS